LTKQFAINFVKATPHRKPAMPTALINTLPRLAVYMLFMPLAGVVSAQTAINLVANPLPNTATNTTANTAPDTAPNAAPNTIYNAAPNPASGTAANAALPLRNLQIELRQLREDTASATSVGAQGAVVVQPGGAPRSGSHSRTHNSTHSRVQGQIDIQADAREGQSRQRLAQQALVLNGRAVNFSIGHTLPLRVVQTAVRGGALQVLPSTVLIERGSGFSATPIWRGGDSAEVQIATQLARGPEQTQTATTLSLPLGEWTTIAESEENSTSSDSRWLAHERSATSAQLRVQMRLSVR
jgi:hypothetical protein